MEGYALATVKVVGKGIVGIGLDILRVSDAQCLVTAIGIGFLTQEVRQTVEQVARCLGIGADGEHIALETSHLQHVHLGLVGSVEVVAHAQNQVVLITVEQQRILMDAVKETVVELGHIDETQVKERERVGHAAAALGPLVAPRSAGNHAGVFGARLIVKVDGKRCRGLNLALERLPQKWEHKLGEGQAQFGRVLAVVVVDQAAQVARDALVGHLGLGTEDFGTLEQIAVLIVHAHAKSQVTLAVGALERDRDRLRLVGLQKHIGIDHEQAIDLAHRTHVDVDLLEHVQAAQGAVGTRHGFGTIQGSRLDVVALCDDTMLQVALAVLDHLDATGQGHRVGTPQAVVHRHRVVVGHIHHVTHGKWPVLGVIGHVVVAVGITAVKRQVHGARAGSGVGREGDVLLVEGKVAVVAQVFGNALSPLIQAVKVQQVATMHGKTGRIGQNDLTQVLVGNLIVDRADVIGLAQRHVKLDTRLALGRVGIDAVIDLIVHEAAVAQRHVQLLGTGHREGAVVDHGRRAHTLDPAIEPLGGIAARHVVDGQLQFETAQHSVIGVLAQIVGQFVGLNIAMRIGNLDLNLVEQHLALRHMLGR